MCVATSSGSTDETDVDWQALADVNKRTFAAVPAWLKAKLIELQGAESVAKARIAVSAWSSLSGVSQSSRVNASEAFIVAMVAAALVGDVYAEPFERRPLGVSHVGPPCRVKLLAPWGALLTITSPAPSSKRKSA
jgi:hypothetical protein